jgi:hypothetical protein
MRCGRLLPLIIYGVLYLSLAAGAIFTEVRLREWLGVGRVNPRTGTGFFVFLTVLLCRVVADRIFTASGLSRAGRIVEGRRPAPHPPGPAPADDTVCLTARGACWVRIAAVSVLIAVLVFALAEVVIPKSEQIGREALPLLYGMFLGFAALACAMRFLLQTVVRADGRGVTVAGRTVPWGDIADCDVVVDRDLFGDIRVTYPVLRNAAGRDLFPGLSFTMSQAPRRDQQWLIEVLKRRFPKLDRDPWDL